MARRRSDASTKLVGRWRIQEMDVWERDALDLVGPAFIEFRAEQTGHFGFIAVEGWMDCREATIDDCPGSGVLVGRQRRMPSGQRPRVVALQPDGPLKGHIFFHMGDDSEFRAERE